MINSQIELRVLPANLTTENEMMLVEGLVNKTESWSETLGKVKRFKEKINKGVFKRAIDKNPVIDFLGEHNSNYLLASTVNDSLQLWEDEEGLKMRARISNTSFGKDFFIQIKEGILGHMSFGFKVVGQEWRKLLDGTFERTITDMELFEISVVRTPAYPQSTISARGLDVVEDVEIPNDLVEVEEIRETEKIEEVKEDLIDSKDEIQEEKEEIPTENLLWQEIANQLKKNTELLESLLNNSKSDKEENISEETKEEVIENSEEPQNEAELETIQEDVKEEIQKEEVEEEPQKEEINFDLSKQKEILANLVMEELSDED